MRYRFDIGGCGSVFGNVRVIEAASDQVNTWRRHNGYSLTLSMKGKMDIPDFEVMGWEETEILRHELVTQKENCL